MTGAEATSAGLVGQWYTQLNPIFTRRAVETTITKDLSLNKGLHPMARNDMDVAYALKVLRARNAQVRSLHSDGFL
jgi:hypothetical protein